MMLWETYLLAQRAIRRNVLRSSLTVLGIVIGVAAVIAMVTLGSGATAKVTGDISKLGSNMLHVRPGQGMRGPGGARANAAPFKVEDAEAIKHTVGGLRAVAPTATVAIQAISGSANWSTSVTGTTNSFLDIQGWQIEEGRSFTPGETKAGKAVCLLGRTVKKELFGSDEATGATMRLGKISFKVIGILKEKGQSSFGTDQDDIVIIPLRTLQRRMKGNTDVSAIMVSADNDVPTASVKADIERLMRERRGIKPNADRKSVV